MRIKNVFGAIEAGGTKFRCAIAISSGEIMKTKDIPTADIDTTMKEIVKFFSMYHIKALGVGCFGPICLNIEDPNYGMILDTPKRNWKFFNIYQYLKENLKVEVYINTDVVASALGEYFFGFHQKHKNLIYLTVGTGIGAGIIYKGEILKGRHHTEMGHFVVSRRSDDYYKSSCIFHENCLEGLASGKSLGERYAPMTHQEMGQQDQIWDLEGYYIAQGIYSYCLALAPEKIIIGGGVSHQPKLIQYIKKHFVSLNNHYYSYKELEDIDHFIVTPALKNDSALQGAVALAVNKYRG